jgi:hypothetical protein
MSTQTTKAATGIDPRGPRFGAGITAVLLLVVIGLSLAGLIVPALIIFSAQTLLFAWGAFAGIARHPYGWLFKKLIRPRLKPPTELEAPTPPTFAQGVGFVITAIGVILTLLGLTLALPIAAALAFVAAFLNSVFGYCLGCQIYLFLVRARVLGRSRPASA